MAQDFSLKELTSCFGLLTDHSSQNAASLGAWLTHKCILIVDHFCPNGFGMGDLSHACTTKFSKCQHMSLCSWVLIWSLVQVSGLARITNWSWPGCFHNTRNGCMCAGPRAVVNTGLPGFDPTPNRGKFKLQGRGAQSPGFVVLFALSCDVSPCASGCLQLKMLLPQP